MLPGNAGEHFAHAAFSDDTGFVFERPPATMALPIASMATMVTLRTYRIPFSSPDVDQIRVIVVRQSH